MKIAVIGSGISGSLTARLLATAHDVTLWEAGDCAGGHAHTADVEAFGRRLQADTGFMVFNRRTYPNFCRLLQMLEVTSQPSDMSFSVHCERTGLEYQGSSLNGLFAQRLNALNPRFLKLLYDILRFNRSGTAAARDCSLQDGQTVGDFLAQGKLGRDFQHQYLRPMAAAIWSCDPQAVLDFPAKFMIGFFANHGLMQLRDRPQWRTIVGGSRKYVSALLEPLAGRVRLNSPVARVTRGPQGVSVALSSGACHMFDAVVFATHADDTLRMLSDPSDREQEILAAFPYQANQAVLHTDTHLLPKRRRAWASWNYRLPSQQTEQPTLTYDLDRLQNLGCPAPLLLTLNDASAVDSSKILRSFNYRHPRYTQGSIAAQQRHAEISGKNGTYFCGAYWGYGFHEDGVNSALAVARQFKLDLEQCIAVCTKELSFTAAGSR